MNEFITLEQASALFAQVNMYGNDNCIFIALADNHSSIGGAYGAIGAIGATAYNAYQSKKDALDNVYCTGFIVNKYELGIGFIPINSQKFSLNPVNMVANPNYCFLVRNEDITDVKITKYAHLNIRSKSVIIKLSDNKNIKLKVNNIEKSIPYHEGNFQKFICMYGK